MKRSARVAGLSAAMFFAARPARADASDPWFGQDKALHFAVTTTLSVGSYTGASFVWNDLPPRIAFAAGAAIAAGIAKEAIDAAGYGTPSWRDFAWDVFGALAGVALAVPFDLGLRHTHAPSHVR